MSSLIGFREKPPFLRVDFYLSMMNGLNYTTQDALVTLGNTRDARKAELSAMLQDSSTTNYVETNSMAK